MVRVVRETGTSVGIQRDPRVTGKHIMGNPQRKMGLDRFLGDVVRTVSQPDGSRHFVL